MTMPIPPLITTEGLVLNNMMPAAGALGGYTPPGTASSEGVSLLMRGMLRAAAVTKDPAMLAYSKFLYEGAIKGFFKGVRPENVGAGSWDHSWICNGGASFKVRGPLQASGDLALSGYIYGRDPQASVVFTDGVGQLTPAPDIVYQAVSSDATFVWKNVFSPLVTGTSIDVDYYIDAKGNKIFGSQRGGSFGQPAIPVGQHTDGAPGKIKLKTTTTGTVGISYSVTVPDVSIAYNELYEAWPMWRKLGATEVSTAGDAIHWFLDAFALGKELEPTNQDWSKAHDEMLKVFVQTCAQESDTTNIFQAGEAGPYNNFPLTYSFGYGRTNIDDPATNWDVVPPSPKYTAARTSDGYVTFTLPEENAVIGSGGAIRYGVVFENNPLFLNYAASSELYFDIKSSIPQVVQATISDAAGSSFDAHILVGPTSVPQSVGVNQFKKYQQVVGDSLGEKSGVWPTDPNEWVMPVYSAVTFPGRRAAIVGDSISFLNTAHVPKKGTTNRFENYGSGFCGWWVNAEQILGGRTILEHGLQGNLTGNNHGTSFAVAGTQVRNWNLAVDYPVSPLIPQVGPMFAAKANLDKFDLCFMMGGTNDLSGSVSAADVLLSLKIASTDIAKNGKWVFLATIPPRTRSELKGYTYAQQTTILARLQTVNQGLRDWLATTVPNIFLVDWWSAMVGPNGTDPSGSVSHATDPAGADTLGNYRPDAAGLVFLNDGLHPGPAGGRVMGEVAAAAMIAAGVPVRESASKFGPLTLGANLLSNPNFTFTQFDTTANPANYNVSDIGWATGLGAQVKVGALHNGFVHGKMPDNWHFYKSSNQENQAIGIGTGGTYSNYMAFTYADMVAEFPAVSQYMGDSTWPLGAVKTSIVMDGGVPALRIDVDIPITGNKNESFVLCAHVPRRQHGPWDNYGYNGPDKDNANPTVVPNTIFAAGDKIMVDCDMVLSGMTASCFSLQQVLYLYQNNPGVTFGAKLLSFGNHPFFWPPSDMDKIRLHTTPRTINIHSPAITVPTPLGAEIANYAELRYEFGFDASVAPAKAVILLKNVNVRKVIGGTP
jgi:lysophospholipase L1-like esterase